MYNKRAHETRAEHAESMGQHIKRSKGPHPSKDPANSAHTGTILPDAADDWMLLELQRAMAVVADTLAYGNLEISAAAEAGAIRILFVDHTSSESSRDLQRCIRRVIEKGGKVVRAQNHIQGLSAVALLRFPLSDVALDSLVDDQSTTSAAVPSHSTPPTVERTLTFFAPVDAPVDPIEPVPPEVEPELALLGAMFAGERKLRQCAPFDGTHLLLQVDSGGLESECYLVLELILPPTYPASVPTVATLFGRLPNGRALSDNEMAACTAACLAHVASDAGDPVLYSLYEAAREWLASLC